MAKEKVTSAKQLRVLVFTPSYHIIDGVTITIRKIKREVEEQGGILKVVTAKDAEHLLEDSPGCFFIPSFKLPYGVEHYAICRMLQSQTKKQLLEFRPNVVHVTAPDPLCYSVCRWARQEAGIPLMATWHSNIPDYLDHYGFVQRTAIKKIVTKLFQSQYSYCNWTFVPQKNLVPKMQREGYENKYTNNKLRVWGRGVDTDLFTPTKRSTEFREKNGAGENDVVVLWVGRCVTEKEPQVFVAVMREMVKRFPNKVKGWVVGRGEWHSQMSSIDNVTGFGWKNSSELSVLYANADILLFPSKVETFGNVTLEAMSSGIACVVDKKCSSHLIDHGKNGYCCSNEEEFIQFTGKLIAEDANRKKMGVEGRNIAESTYKLKEVMKSMVQNYIDVANFNDSEVSPVPSLWTNAFVYVIYLIVDSGGYILFHLLGNILFPSADRRSQYFKFVAAPILIYVAWKLFSLVTGL
mmetsp:Transcript_6420/g.7346  ORF Transcript_6420/g.7346 Transcript_6420/m.7346 type:complete len:465 (-) Transcript_6420:33-1427(-)|eukprot:CAMPEP_0184072112 /NCGR_PEP_ID=MMETSP0957-20130417/57822_1 /TAXON_ID=627963 /ORGANISM="Aplanochytrium sp, Strain PBS07" /LENGTH=464 /DNA_ID=CAMNT_0026372999 /DNA_START=151 /DNA_END=1545 /DNA_ORIENTATION=+